MSHRWMPVEVANPKPVSDFASELVWGTRAPIAIADHCYGCTAGQGSSCAGALA